MKKIVLIAGVLASTTSFASDYAIGLGVGTFGAGVDFTYNASEKVNIRAMIHGGEFSAPDFEADGVDYTGDIEVGGQAILVDLFPTGGKFRFTAGIVNNVSELIATATTTGLSVGDSGDTFDGTAEIDLEIADGVVPYFGIGWGNPVSDGIPLGFSIDLGVIPASPEVGFELVEGIYRVGGAGPGVDVNDPSIASNVQTAINQEVARINDEDLEDINFFPILNMALTYQF